MLKRIGEILFVSLFFFCVPLFLAGQEFKATVDRRKINRQETIELSLTFSGVGNIPGIGLPSIPGFKVHGPSQNSSTSWVNGVMSATISYIFTLEPEGEGKFTVPGFEIDIGGQKLKSDPIEVEVVRDNSTQELKDVLFIKISPSKKKMFRGEQFHLGVEFFFRNDLRVADLTWNSPEPKGCWVENLGQPQQSERVVDGQNYGIVTLRQSLVPLQAGKLTIADVYFKMNLLFRDNRRSRSPFDDFFGGFGGMVKKPVRIDAEPLDLEILELPTEGRPASFKGLVGDFRGASHWDKQSLKEGENVTLEIRLEGRGSLRELAKISLPQSPDFKFYEDKPIESREFKGGHLEEAKTFKIAAVPLRSGKLALEPIEISWFNPATGKYVAHLLNLPPLEVAVNPEKAVATPFIGSIATGTNPLLGKRSIESLGNMLVPLKLNENHDSRLGFRGVPMADLLIFFLFPWAVLAIQEGWIRYREFRARDPMGYRRREAMMRASDELAGVGGRDTLEAYRLASRAILHYFEMSWGLPDNRLTPETLERESVDRGIQPGGLAKILEFLRQSDAIQFGAASSGSPIAVEQLVAALRELDNG